MKLKILLASLLSAAASAKGVYVEGDATGVEVVVAAAKFGGNEAPAPAANHRHMVSMGRAAAAWTTPSSGNIR